MASGSKTSTLPTYLQCSCCKNVQQIHRKRSKGKEKNHTKHMWCYICKETTAHIEKKEDLFLPEWLRENDALEM